MSAVDVHICCFMTSQHHSCFSEHVTMKPPCCTECGWRRAHVLAQPVRPDEDVEVGLLELLGEHVEDARLSAEVSQMINDQLQQQLEGGRTVRKVEQQLCSQPLVSLGLNGSKTKKETCKCVCACARALARACVLTGSLWLKPFSRIISPCSPATSLYSSWATSAS